MASLSTVVSKFLGKTPVFKRLSGTVGLTNLLDMTSLAASGRLQNAIKYCPKVHKTRAVGKGSYNSAAVQPRINKFYTDIHGSLIHSHTRYGVISYFRLAFIGVENAASK